jgi:hypothetical protein
LFKEIVQGMKMIEVHHFKGIIDKLHCVTMLINSHLLNTMKSGFGVFDTTKEKVFQVVIFHADWAS